MKKLLKIVLVSSLSLLCFSCYYDEEIEMVNLPPGTEAKFEADITPIFIDNNCIECHNGSRDPDLRAGNEYNSLVPDYVTAGNANASRLYTFLAVDGHGDLSATELEFIKLWINDGALDN